MSTIYPHVNRNGELAVKIGRQWRIGGTRAWRNNNCGNLRYVGQPSALGADEKNFAVFSSYEAGFNALKQMIFNAATGKSKVYKPDMNLYDFFAVYAPAFENNDRHYAETVAKALNVSPETFKISQLA